MTKALSILTVVVLMFGMTLYPKTFVVTGIAVLDDGTYELYLADATGHEYVYDTEDGDWFVGDVASALMCDMGTDVIIDDVLLKLHYSGYVFDQLD